MIAVSNPFSHDLSTDSATPGNIFSLSLFLPLHCNKNRTGNVTETLWLIQFLSPLHFIPISMTV